jgi:hypothetical protein
MFPGDSRTRDRPTSRAPSAALPAAPGGAGPGCAPPPGAQSGGALPHNPVYTSRHAHLTGREHNKLNDGKARSALAAALLRQLFVVITQRVPWDPVIASGAALPGRVTATAARCNSC